MAEEKGILFSELSQDNDFVSRVRNFHNSVDRIDAVLSELLDANITDKLTTEELVKHDLFLTYALNSLFWLYLRTRGMDPTKHGVRSEIDRIKTYHVRAKAIKDRKTMPRIDVDAARRFIRSGLWQPNQEEEGGSINDENASINGNK